MSEIRCSNSLVRLLDGRELYCENTVADIVEQLSTGDSVILDLTDENIKIPVDKHTIVSYSYTD